MPSFHMLWTGRNCHLHRNLPFPCYSRNGSPKQAKIELNLLYLSSDRSLLIASPPPSLPPPPPPPSKKKERNQKDLQIPLTFTSSNTFTCVVPQDLSSAASSESDKGVLVVPDHPTVAIVTPYQASQKHMQSR